MLKERNAVKSYTNHLGLGASQNYTLAWTIYPSSDRNYFSFVNAVRRDWGVNITCQGPFAFTRGDIIPERSLLLHAIDPWYFCHNGTPQEQADYLSTVQYYLSKLSADPQAVGLGMIETNLVKIDCRTLPNGGAAILNNYVTDTYGWELTSEQTQLLAGLPWFNDSMLKTSDGRAIVDSHYVSSPYINLMVYPATGNYHLQYMLSQIDYLMDTAGFRGIYLDQFSLGLGSLTTSKDRCDYSQWDSHTVDLNVTGNISRQYKDVSLAGAQARATIIQHIVSKGGKVVSNGHSTVRETTGVPCMNFQESQSINPVPYLQYEPPVIGDMAAGHLDTPIALGIRPYLFGQEAIDHRAECIHKWVITCLKNGQLHYYYSYDIPSTGPGSGGFGELNYMYPFTPVELHSGWVVGEERIITCVSGTFTWNHPSQPICLLFDLTGMPITPNVTMTQRGSVWDVTINLADWTQVAVINAGTGSLNANVTLADYHGDPAMIVVKADVVRNGSVIASQVIRPETNPFTISFPGLASGSYDVIVSASKCLRKIAAGQVVTSNNSTNVNITMVNGDMDGDNEVTNTDLSVLLSNLH